MTGTSAKLRPAWPWTVNFSGGTSIWRCSDGRRRKNIYEANDEVVSVAEVQALKNESVSWSVFSATKHWK